MITLDTYKEIKVLKFPNMIARVHIPDLTPAERERRMNYIKKAAADLLKTTKKGSDLT